MKESVINNKNSLNISKNSANRANRNIPKIITVGGGKGGVGKTIFAVLLGLSLVKHNKRTVIVDADFRSPSLNSLLRIKSSKISLKEFLADKTLDINEVVQLTKFKDLRILSGASGILGMTEYCFQECSHLIKNLRNINTDFIIVDLESGTSIEAINLFLTADERIIIANPNPMSIQENYSFLKLCLFKKLRDTFRDNSEFLSLIKTTFESNNSQSYQHLKHVLNKSITVDNSLKSDLLQPKLVLNKMRKKDELLEAYAFQMVCEDLLGITLDYWGNIDYNEQLRAMIKSGNINKLVDNKTVTDISQRLINNKSIGTSLKKSGIKKRNINYFDNDDITCSTKCAQWVTCYYKRGGYPCRLKYMGYLCTSAESIQ